MANEKANKRDLDVVIVGAGISGINSAYHIQTNCPTLSYTILEGLKELGGTWSLFKYPGVRSDSDLITFGFSWFPWTEKEVIAEGHAIKNYLANTAKHHHIDEKIQYEHFVNELNWSSSSQKWTIKVKHGGENIEYQCKYIVMGTGYYDYKQPLEARVPGIENFKGQVVHPQFWPEDLNYSGKKVIIIGSGATAVTLLPNLAKKAAKVTQVQRSPGYFLVLPKDEPLNNWLRAKLPTAMSKRLIRFKYILGATVVYNFCRLFPDAAKKFLRKGVAKELPPGAAIDPHFTPEYQPWDQRMCLTPGGDYFEAYRNGNADIKTGHIQTVTEDGLIMKNGDRIEADIIITATGLKMQVGGGAKVTVDGRPVNFADKFMWKGTMLQDIPNLWYIIGYANMSWTLAADASGRLITRMINSMESKGLKSATPWLTAEQAKEMDEANIPLLPLKSTYVNSALERRIIPRAGKSGVWKPRINYFVDMWRSVFGSISEGINYR